MGEEMIRSQDIDEIASALAASQGIIRNPEKTKINPHFKSKYADLAAGLDCIRPALSANGIAIVQATDIHSSGNVILITTLLHSSGQYIGCTYPVGVPGNHQQLGAALTYAKRQALFSLVGVCGDDDLDGEDTAAGVPEKLSDAVQAYLKAARDEMSDIMSTDELTAWWREQKDQRAALGIINTTTGPAPGYKELFAAFSARGKELAG